MTRLQEKLLSCECRKTKRKQSDLVTTSKVYQTRSEHLRRRGKLFNKDKIRRRLNSYNSFAKFQRNGFYHKMETSIIIQVPHKERKFMLNDVLPSTKFVGDNVVGPNTRTLIENTLDNFLSSEIKKSKVQTNFLKTNSNLKELSPRSKNIVSNDFFSPYNGEKTNCDFENDVFKSVLKSVKIERKNENFDKSQKIITDEILKYELFQTDATDFKIEGVLPNFKNDHIRENLKSENQKSEFVMHLHSHEEPKVLELEKKNKGVNRDLKRKLKCDEKLQDNSNLETSIADDVNLPKKKRGRKPKQRGPFLHYLDIYVKNKAKYTNNDYLKNVSYKKSTDLNMEYQLNKNLLVEPQTQLSLKNLKPHEDKGKELQKKNCCHTFGKKNLVQLSNKNYLLDDSSKILCNITTSFIDENKLQIKRKRGRPKLIKNNISEDKCSFYVDKTVDCILGYRNGKSSTEVLVLFRNGTSNWVEEGDLSKDFTLKNFFQNQNQNFSVMNRLPYKIHATGNNRIEKQIEVKERLDVEINNSMDIEIKEKCLNLNMTLESQYLSSESTNCINEKSHINANIDISDSTNLNAINAPNLINETLHELQSSIFPPNITNIQNNTFDQVSTLEKAISIVELNDLCKHVISSDHIKLYPYELKRPIVSRFDGDFMHIYLKHIPIALPAVLKELNDGLDLHSCSVLINLLEDCEISEKCQVVVISGIDEFFGHTRILEKLIKNPASVELKSYQEDVSMLRYLIQTIRNFSKPIVAVIKKAVSGLSASLISLFDMVFDEHCECVDQKDNKSNSINVSSNSNERESNECKNFVFPRVIGLTHNNEAQIMGNHPRQTSNDFNIFDISMFSCKNLSNQLRASVQHMCNNGEASFKNEVCLNESFTSDIINKHLTTPNVIDHTEQTVDIENLKHRLNIEKEKYQTDLRIYLDSLKFS